MKLHLIDRRSRSNSSFTVSHHKYPSFLKVWHYHPELELVLLLKSTGTRFVGDSIDNFEPGQLVLLGENLPHMWLNDAHYYEEGSELFADAVAVHFKMDFLGPEFFYSSELLKIEGLLSRAKQGILFKEVDKETKTKIQDLLLSRGAGRIIKLIDILDTLSKWQNVRYLSSEGFINSFNRTDSNNLKQVYEYMFKNFHKPISSREVAKIARMNPSAFSRFFKRIHKKTFTRYLNEIRIGYACKLLIEGKQKIIAICFDCGFNNLSNFNRQFKLIRGIPPTEFISFYNEKHKNKGLGQKKY